MTEIEFTRIQGAETIPAQLEELYLGAFPEEERRPLEQIRQRVAMSDPFFYFFALSHNGETVGFATVWRLPGATYVEHFAIYPALRGKSFGSATVKLPESSPQAARRIAFYERCGLTAMEDFPYYQPPYREGGPQVPMMLMSSQPLDNATSFVILLHTIVYNQ